MNKAFGNSLGLVILWSALCLAQSPAAETSVVRQVRLNEVKTWACNIQDVETPRQRKELVGTHFDMYVLEPVVTEKGNASFDCAGLVRDIRDYNIKHYQKSPIILAYINIGEAESWRWYWKADWGVGNPAWIARSDPDGWQDCYPVAFWHPEWQDLVIYGRGGKSQVEESLKAGFDGICMGWVEAFGDPLVAARAKAGKMDPAQAMFDFIGRIRDYARNSSAHANTNYLIVAQNAPELFKENPQRYLALIDGIACEGIWFDGTGGFNNWDEPRGYNIPTDRIFDGWTEKLLEYLAPMQGKLPIFCLEYAQDVKGEEPAKLVYTRLAPRHGFIPYCTRRALSQLSRTPYPLHYNPCDY